jgi:transposase
MRRRSWRSWAARNSQLPVAVAHPRQGRHVATARGQRAKTERLDAAALAPCADALRPTPRPERAERAAQELGALLARRGDLLGMRVACGWDAGGMRVAEEHRLGVTRVLTVRERIQAHLDGLKEEVQEGDHVDHVDHELRRQGAASPLWRAQEDLLRTVPGGGRTTALPLLADLPARGRLARGQSAALGGVAPLTRDCGAQRGRRSIWGGRATVRAALYRAALRATRCNPARQLFSSPLVAAGNPNKGVLVACMPQLLTIRTAMMQHQMQQQTPWHAQAA